VDANYTITYAVGGVDVDRADTSTTAADKSATFGDLSVTLMANVTANSPSTATVNEGTITFVVKLGSTTLATLSLVNVSGDAASASLTLGPSFVVGSYNIYATYNPASVAPNFNGSTVAAPATLNIGKKQTTLTVAQPANTQYSDPITLMATVSPVTLNGQSITGSVEFFINGTSVGSAPINGNGIATLTNVPNFRAPGNYNVTATFTSTNLNFTDSSGGPATLTITQEDARVTYTGALFASTASITSSTATVTLAVTIQDITAVTGDPAYDAFFGDIRFASVTFVDRDAGNAVLCTASVGLVNSSDTKTGTATCNWTANIGNSDSVSFTVGIIVNNYYTRYASVDDTVVTVSKPLTSNFITGGGYLVLTNSAGLKAGTTGTKNNFGFSVKYNKTGTNLQGKINTIIRRLEADGIVHVYQIKGNAMTSLSVKPSPCLKATATSKCTAVFNGKASIQDITNPLAPVSVDGNATLQVTMTDKGEPGSADSIAITVWNKSGGLWFSSNWDGTKTTEKFLGGGNLVIH
jgi:hypothetical protein